MPSQFFSTLQNSCLDTRGWQRPVALLSGALLAFVGLVPAAFAQDKPSLASSPLRQGDIVLQGAITKGATAIEVQITTGIKTEPVTPARVELDSAKRTFRITLADPLKQGQQVSAPANRGREIEHLDRRSGGPCAAGFGSPGPHQHAFDQRQNNYRGKWDCGGD